jgi:cobaltochelatase CobT
MVLTDGRPSDSYTQKANDRHYLIKHLDRVVQQIEKQSDVELVAIGIGHQVSQTYRRSLFVNDLDQLGAIMVNELTGLLAH